VVAVALVAVASSGSRAAARDIDWKQVEREAATMLAAYIKIDTSNPPGNEAAAARFLADEFRAEGIAAQLYEPEPGRGSVSARLSGTGEKRPIILLSHLDVVPANAAEWSVPPFSGEVRDGYVYGRGAIDCKGVGVVNTLAMLLLRRHEIMLERDVIFVATADEEAGGKLGAGWVAENALATFGDVEFVLNEGGEIRSEDGHRVYEVSVAEKTPCWLKLTARGKPGHGSTPPETTATTRLIRALDRVLQHQPEVRVVPEVQAYYAALAEHEQGDRKAQFADLAASLQKADFRTQFLADPRHAALVRNTIAPTVFHGSQKTNVIPATASAELDCRLLPGQSADTFVQSIKDSIDDREVEVEVLLNFAATSSPTNTELFEAIETVARDEKAAIAPAVLRGFTDSHFFRNKGVVSYGFTPFELPPGRAQPHARHRRAHLDGESARGDAAHTAAAGADRQVMPAPSF
jgi:acetylornithine deacetylase/succinyl-diaminopimelate desuccinylase-like protein